MPCFHPLPAWRTSNGEITLSKERADGTYLRLPCGGCLGCRTARAKEWALRCHLELQKHETAVFTTLTYDDDHLPITLQKRHLQLWLKRLRKNTTPNKIRFFASGEYGETTYRPHYHAIIYGLSVHQQRMVEDTWGMGQTRTEHVTPARIAYTAGYCSKKIGYKLNQKEQIDLDTGEVYIWQPPFIQMSRNPGIGDNAKQWPESWRLVAIHNGQKQPVPRYLHEAWKQIATPEDLEELELEKVKLSILRDTSEERLKAAEKLLEATQKLRAVRRTY